MTSKSHDDGFTNLPPGKPGPGIAIGGILVGIVVVLLVGALPLMLLLPALNQGRVNGRHRGCLNNMRSLAIAWQNHESAVKRYPTASNGSTDILKGQVAGGYGDIPVDRDDGFSWLFQLLPYIEEDILAKEARKAIHADENQTGPFDVDFVNDSGQHYATIQISMYRCPSYSGNTTTMLGDVAAAVGTYCAIVGSDVAEGDAAPWKTSPNWENGALPSACWNTPHSQTTGLMRETCREKGLRRKHISDGISHTIVATETRESRYSAWISGASMWVVAASPNSLAADWVNVAVDPTDHWLAMLQDEETRAVGGAGLSLNFGTELPGLASDHYLKAADWATNVDRSWGPSSEHSQGVVIHVFADAHVQAITPDVDPSTYLRFITRSDGDPASPDHLE